MRVAPVSALARARQCSVRWLQPNQDLSAYFNFGLNERGFKELVKAQVLLGQQRP